MESAKSIWDHHCSYQWTYFPEESKQLIQFFLSDRIYGKNLDIGAGWYLYHPNSTAVDISSKGLEYNLAKEKVLFDLDSLRNGKRLPIPDKSYNSATLVSVWQYLKNRRALLSELERILMPGSEVFIINQGGSGLTELMIGTSYPEDIEKEVTEAGYDCIREIIPFGEPKNPFQSVTVAMPDNDLFGRHSFLRDRERKIEESRKRTSESKKFYEEFAFWETRRAFESARKLSVYPITRFSQEYQVRIQKFGDDFQQKTGELPLIFMEFDILPSLHLAIADNPPIPHLVTLPKVRKDKQAYNDYDELLKEHNLRMTRYLGYFQVDNSQELDYKLVELCSKLRPFSVENQWYDERNRIQSDLKRFTNFLASIPLTTQTQMLQSQIYSRLKSSVGDLDKRISDERIYRIFFALREDKQRRKINNLVAIKERIRAEEIPTICQARFDYMEILQYYMIKVRKDISDISSAWPPPLSND